MKIISKFKFTAAVGFSFTLFSNAGCNKADDSLNISSTQEIFCNTSDYMSALEQNPDLDLLASENNWLTQRANQRKIIKKGYKSNGKIKYGKMDLQAIVTKSYQTDVWYYFVYAPQEEFEGKLPEIYVEGLDCNQEIDIKFPYTTNSTKFWHFDAIDAIENHFIEGGDLGWLLQKFEV